MWFCWSCGSKCPRRHPPQPPLLPAFLSYLVAKPLFEPFRISRTIFYSLPAPFFPLCCIDFSSFSQPTVKSRMFAFLLPILPRSELFSYLQKRRQFLRLPFQAILETFTRSSQSPRIIRGARSICLARASRKDRTSCTTLSVAVYGRS
jgi:hypothetical protein